MQGTTTATLRESSLVLEEVQRLLENDSFQFPEFNLRDEALKWDKMLLLKNFLDEGLASPAIDAFPAQKEAYLRRLAELKEDIKCQTSFLGRVSVALKTGYSPFTVNKTWFCGLLEPEQDSMVQDTRTEEFIKKISEHTGEVATISSKKYPLFNQVFSKIVWEKYQLARNLGIFDVILVHSPVPDHFDYMQTDVRVIDVRVVRLDPVLVGYITNGGASQIKFKENNNEFYFVGKKEKVIPFLIAQWDLSKDLYGDKA